MDINLRTARVAVPLKQLALLPKEELVSQIYYLSNQVELREATVARLTGERDQAQSDLKEAHALAREGSAYQRVPGWTEVLARRVHGRSLRKDDGEVEMRRFKQIKTESEAKLEGIAVYMDVENGSIRNVEFKDVNVLHSESEIVDTEVPTDEI